MWTIINNHDSLQIKPWIPFDIGNNWNLYNVQFCNCLFQTKHSIFKVILITIESILENGLPF